MENNEWQEYWASQNLIHKIKKAIKFAANKHKDQKRKFHNEPYINHPIRVANLVHKFTKNIEMIIAAILHDTIEDTKTTYEEILNKFGELVAELVSELTSDKTITKQEKPKYLTRKMNKMSEDALTIKLCDRLDNVSGLNKESINFVKRYKAETQYILTNLKRNLSPIQKELIEKIRAKINTD